MKQTLSPKNLAEAIGVSESSLKRWADQGRLHVQRTVGGHRRIEVTEAVRFIREQGHRLLKPQMLGLVDTHQVDGRSRGDLRQLLTDTLQQGRAMQVRSLVMSIYLDGVSAASICDGPMSAAMRYIGGLWQHGPEGIFIEHRASILCEQALSYLRTMMPPGSDDAPLAIGGAPQDDSYSLPSQMVTTSLAGEGWRVMNLGPYTPVEALLAAVERCGPTLVWYSMSTDRPAGDAVSIVRRLAEAVADRGVSVAVGGRAWPATASVGMSNVFMGGSMSELIAYARGLAAGQGGSCSAG